MLKLIRANQKKFLAGLTILSMITFLVNRGSNGDRTAADQVYGTIGGKPIYTSEVLQARAELTALKNEIDFSSFETDRQQIPRNLALMRLLISEGNKKPELYLLLRHEANSAGIQVNNDAVNEVIANYTHGDNYTHGLDSESDAYPATHSGVAEMLRIISRYDQLVDMLKVTKPMTDQDLAKGFESLQMDCIQFKAADYITKVSPPTTQQLQDQFNTFAAIEPHHPVPTTNPFGFGYRLPVRAKLAYVLIPHDAVTAAVAATKFKFPEPDWEVQAWKYYLAHQDEFIQPPTTAPTTAPIITTTTQPAGPQPFKAVHDKILTNIREPMVAALMDKVQSFISSTLNTDWQTYSQNLSSSTPGPEPLSSLGVPYTSPDYLVKLAAKVQSQFNVTIKTNQVPGDLSQDQIAALPDIGTPVLAEAAVAQANDYLERLKKSDKSAAAWMTHPSIPITAAYSISTIFFRLDEVLPSEPAPSLASVLSQVQVDALTAAAYKMALAQATTLVTGDKDLPLYISAPTGSKVVHIDDLSMLHPTIPEIKPDLGNDSRPFLAQAYQLLGTYDPASNYFPKTIIELPDQQRVFTAQLSRVVPQWNADTFFRCSMEVRAQAREYQEIPLFQEWFNFDAVARRTDFKSTAKSGG